MGRRETTWESYRSKVERWAHFCQVVWPGHGRAPLPICPARPEHIVAYLGFLCEEDKVHASSLQPYLSAINALHADLGFERPAMGHLVQLARKGFAELEGELDPDQAQRAPLPASTALAIVRHGLLSDDPRVIRACACVGLQFTFFARSDTGIQALRSDVALDASGLHWRERGKTIPRLRPESLTVPFDDAHPVHQLLRRHLALCPSALPDSLLWRLPSDPSTAWTPALVNSWLQQCLEWICAVPPPGVAWTSHSLRSGGATAALAIGVDVYTIARWGIWASINSVQPYIDPLVKGDHAALVFFGHLLKRQPSEVP